MLYDAARYADAASRFKRAIAVAPSSLYAQWLGRAYGLEAQNFSLFAKPGQAIRSREALERAVAMDPDNIGARSDLAAYYAAAPGFMGGGLAKAQAQVAEIRKRDPYLGQVRAGDLLWDDQHTAEAEQTYQAAARLDSQRPEAHGRLASIYVESGRYPQAFAEWDAMLQGDPSEWHALYGLGKTAVLSGERLAEGEATLKAYLAVARPDPDSPPPAKAHFYLGRLLARRGDPDARAEFATAFRLDPKMEEARGVLAALNK